jgi:exonuclease SbcD
MRILHTADWHVGKRLGRVDRMEEAGALLDEVVEVARARDVDAVLVAGDLFDRAGPPLDSLRVVLETLVRLADGGARRVVAIPGNHDDPRLFRVLEPLLGRFGVTLVHKPLPPAEGGVVEVAARDGSACLRIACVPFVHEASVIDVLEAPEEGFKSYADRMRAITAHYANWLVAHPRPDAIDLLMGHLMVHGAIPSGSERELHIGEAYMATADAIPAAIKYAALGHIHRPQEAPGAAVPAWFCGSLMQLDFGEAEQEKSVRVVALEPGMKPARVEAVALARGKRLVRFRGTLDELRARAPELSDAYVHASIASDGPDPGLADEVRAVLPEVIQVHADYERTEIEPVSLEGSSLTELYRAYRVRAKGAEPSGELVGAFESLLDEVGVSW